MIDRFGTFPKEVQNLIEIARIKNICKDKKIEKIKQNGNNVVVYFSQNGFDDGFVQRVITTYGMRVKFSRSMSNYVTFNLQERTEYN